MLSQVLHSNTAIFHCGTNVTRADRQRTELINKKGWIEMSTGGGAVSKREDRNVNWA